ncbi:glycosyltransferase family 39 protein [Microbacteriaceae bacterium K1510]|uniref:ArnT family glycosyltransferase n=1 Tax=Microbacterium sp. 4NA327F11 TaxID=2502229 RepID=UPI0010F52F5C|nr:glycosyltransferase family 39 protein [Microbacterium sp. 4NA327F11]MCK9915399.1 glycosyltransferase family 39 protein [Microbacteriaceae bacterium K1510]
MRAAAPSDRVPRVRLRRLLTEPWPVWAAVLVMTAASTVLMVWNLGRGDNFAFYESAAKSMSESWRAFVFGAFDPGATVTLDKLSGFLVPQAASAALFGFSTSALALPQVVEGVVTIWCCALVGLRWGGRPAALVAAGAAASMPIFVSMFGHPMEDGLVTMALAVALVWWQRAVLTGSWWALAWSGIAVGVGFQAKMMQAWFVLPGLVIALLVLGGMSRVRRLARAGTFAAVAVAASVGWMAIVQVVPSGVRPFVDGSTNDNLFAMVFGYNGIDRVFPGLVPGAVGPGEQSGGATAAISSMLGSTGGFALHPKLFAPENLTQIGWLYPAAAAGIVLAFARWWPRRDHRSAAERAAFATTVAVTLWLAVAAAVLTASVMPHTAYLAALGVQLALLAAIAFSRAWTLQRSGRRRDRLVLPALLAGQTVWAVALASWGAMPAVLAVPMGAVSICGAAVVLTHEVRSGAVLSPRAASTAVAAVAGLALLAGPALWSVQALDAGRDGSGIDAYLGWRPPAAVAGVASPRPARTADVYGFPVAAASDSSVVDPGATESFHVSPPNLWGGAPTASTPVDDLLRVIAADASGAPAPAAGTGAPIVTDSWAISADIIDTTGQAVLTDGGYSGAVPVFTTAQLKDLVDNGSVRWFVVKAGAGAKDPVAQFVAQQRCTVVRTWGTDASVSAGALGLLADTRSSVAESLSPVLNGLTAEADAASAASSASATTRPDRSFTLWQCRP